MLNVEQKSFYDYIIESFERKQLFSTCLLGAPGTGKTQVLKQLITDLTLKHARVFPLAYTGTAAVQTNSQTIHSMFGLKVSDSEYKSSKVCIDSTRVTIEDLDQQHPSVKYEDSPIQGLSRIPNENVIIIDELSLCGLFLIYAIERTLRIIFDNSRDFGGVNMIFTGDFLQLDPVSDIPLWRDLYFPFRWNVFEFTISMRNDLRLFEICNEVRSGIHSSLLKMVSPVISEFDMNTLYIFTHRQDVDDFNLQIFNQYFKELQNGLRVIFNKKYNNITNGCIGYITNINGDNVDIETEQGNITVPKDDISTNPNTPITICFGTTIHKIQGQTINKICVRIRSVFEYALLNVSLSRVRSLEDIKVETLCSNELIFSPDVLIDYNLKKRYIDNFKKILESEKCSIKSFFQSG